MRPATVSYPFGALVGQESLKRALLLGAIDPSLGGVLIRGEKGTAKSTAARALADLLPPLRVAVGCPHRCDPDRPWPDCPTCVGDHQDRPSIEIPTPHVDLPLGATEDRVLGTLDLERILKDGRAMLRPGLLAEAHRGVLYIDEVNLLADHLVDSLLDVAASGINTVQRDGVAARHPARFLLIGSMNAEEGELRPQLLDRFGLAVEVAAPTEVGPRAEVVRRRLAFEADPVAFAARWATEERALGARIAQARSQLAGVVMPDGLLTSITRLCIEARVDGLRADIAMYKASRALAALDGRPKVRRADLQDAAELVLPHRRRRQPGGSPGPGRDEIDRMLGPDEPSEADSQSPPPTTRPDDPGASSDPAGSNQPGPIDPDHNEDEGDDGNRPDRVLPPGDRPRLPDIGIDPAARFPGPGLPGQHVARAGSAGGAYLRPVAAESPRELAVDATLRAAITRHPPGPNGRPTIERGDLHGKEREATVSTLVLFVVDTSGSMGARRRTEMVKAAVLDLLDAAYQRRDRVAVITARGPQAEVALGPTRSVDQAEQALRQLPTGGRTPLAHALTLAAGIAASADRHGPTLLVVLTDGRANVPLPGTQGDPWEQVLAVAPTLAALGASAVVFDTEEGFGRAGRAADLATAIGANHLPLARFSTLEVQTQADGPLVRDGRP